MSHTEQIKPTQRKIKAKYQRSKEKEAIPSAHHPNPTPSPLPQKPIY
jgi:hypothetical protein